MFQRRRLRFTLSAFCLGMIVLHVAVAWLARQEVVDGLPDLRIFYTAGLMLRRGQGHLLYDDDLQLKTQAEFVKLRPGLDAPMPYNHPPFEAILYVPFTYLPFLRAYGLWFFLNGLLLALIVHVIRPWISAAAAEFPELLFLAPLAFFPVFYALMQGQDSILLLTLYSLAYAAFRRGRDLQAGVWLGLGLFKFHLVLPFAFILLLRRRWRAIGGVLVSGCCEFAISWALVGWRELFYYPRFAWHVNRLQAPGVIVPTNMPNLRGLLIGWTSSVAVRSRMELVLLLVSVGLLVWAAKQWAPWDMTHAERWNAGFSIAVVTTYLVGYHGYNTDLSLVFLPALITFNRLLEMDGRAVGTALRVILGLLFLSPLYLLLTLRYERQRLFSLVLLAFIFCLAESSSKGHASGTDSVVVASSS
jgi:hypothetical protein